LRGGKYVYQDMAPQEAATPAGSVREGVGA
jgi:hypothetical protein